MPRTLPHLARAFLVLAAVCAVIAVLTYDDPDRPRSFFGALDRPDEVIITPSDGIDHRYFEGAAIALAVAAAATGLSARPARR